MALSAALKTTGPIPNRPREKLNVPIHSTTKRSHETPATAPTTTRKTTTASMACS